MTGCAIGRHRPINLEGKRPDGRREDFGRRSATRYTLAALKAYQDANAR